MRNLRLAKAATGLIAGAAALCLLSLPASANTVAVTTTAGTLDIYTEDPSLLDSIDLSNPGPDCAATSSSVTTTGNATSGTVSATLSSNSATNIAGTNYKVTLTTSVSGSYSGGGSSVSVTGSATATLVRTTGAGSCTPISGAGNCTFTAGNLALSGSISAANPSSLVAGDSATLTGGNSLGDDLVSGTATNCGVIISANNGYVDAIGVTVEV